MGVKPIDKWEIIGERKERRRQAKRKGDKPRERRPNLRARVQIRGAGIKPVSKFGKKVEVNRVNWKEKRVPKYRNQEA